MLTVSSYNNLIKYEWEYRVFERKFSEISKESLK